MNKRYIILQFVFLLAISGYTTTSFAKEDSKIKGISFVASNSRIDKTDVTPLIEINANWVTIMPFGFIGTDGKLKYNSKWQWWGEKKEGVIESIKLCKESNLKIMLKPQVWRMDAYTGDFAPDTEAKWVKFENSYYNFIMDFVDIAIANNVEMFCIGTEWREFVANRPSFWNKLIKSIRAKYKGKLTYAANWDDYKKVPFWRQLDYIGVDGYFPISYSVKPSLNELIKGWSVHKEELKNLSKSFGKKIIFTEIGYRSIVGATVKPWEHQTGGKYSEEVQNLAYKALFSSLWKEPWFKGIFIWKWFHDHNKQGGKGNLGFTPQNKLAEKTIKDFWAKDE